MGMTAVLACGSTSNRFPPSSSSGCCRRMLWDWKNTWSGIFEASSAAEVVVVLPLALLLTPSPPRPMLLLTLALLAPNPPASLLLVLLVLLPPGLHVSRSWRRA